MTALVTEYRDIAVLSVAFCATMSLVQAAVAWRLEVLWARWLAVAFAVYAVAAMLTVDMQAYVLTRLVLLSVSNECINFGLWDFARLGSRRTDPLFWFIVLLPPLTVAGAAAGQLVLSDFFIVGTLHWAAWALLFLRVRRAEPNMWHGFNVAACASYPLWRLLGFLGWVSPAISDRPAALAVPTLGLALLTTGVLRANRELEAELRRRSQAEAALQELNNSLEERVELRTQELRETISGLESFNASVSHDLRGPLGGIAGVADLAVEHMRAGDLDGAARMMGMVGSQAQVSFKLVDALLMLARASNAPLNRERIDLTALARAVSDELTREEGVSLAAVSVADMAAVEADVVLVRQVLRNLISNGLKFSRGRPEPRVEVGAQPANGVCEFYVCDHGNGFPQEQAERIFAPFVRLSGSGAEGFGVGLSIVKRIVNHHGGAIRAEGRPGQGARFLFTLQPGLQSGNFRRPAPGSVSP